MDTPISSQGDDLSMLETDSRNGVMTITFTREPDVTLDARLADAMHSALNQAHDQNAKVLLLRSARPSFCAGADISRLEAWTATDGDREIASDADAWDDLFSRLESLPISAIAEINGAVLGAGLGLALACDFRIASPGAALGAPEARFGILPAGGTIERLVRIAGPATARRLLLSGEILKGKQALAAGLVDRLVDDQSAAEEAFALASRIAALSAPAVAHAKKLIAATLQGDLGLPREKAALIDLLSRRETKDALSSLVASIKARNPSSSKRNEHIS